jgi:hypothetical protein
VKSKLTLGCCDWLVGLRCRWLFSDCAFVSQYTVFICKLNYRLWTHGIDLFAMQSLSLHIWRAAWPHVKRVITFFLSSAGVVDPSPSIYESLDLSES